MKLHETIFGKEHPSYAMSLHNLAAVYIETGRHSEAEALDLEAARIRKTALGEKHPDYLGSLNSLANLFYETGDWRRAEALHQTIAERLREAV